MGQNLNIGQDASLVVFGNPLSFQKLIKSHGQLCKIKFAIACPCVGSNHGSPKIQCPICLGNGYTYTYQRRFLIADEDSRCNDNVTELYPYFVPVLEVTKAERMLPDFQGGIQQFPVTGFDDTTIFVNNSSIKAKKYEKKRVTYFFDGWTKVEGDILQVDSDKGLMWPTQTFFNAGVQSSNPLQAEADIAQIDRIYNFITGVDIDNYTKVGNTIKTKEPIISGQMKADYYYSDLTQIITADLKIEDNNEQWTHDMESGNVRMAIFPWWNISKGDIIVIAADANYRTEMLNHTSDMDQLWEIEIFELNDFILDDDGKTYQREEDYILFGRRYLKWISENKPRIGALISVRYGFKPSFIVFSDNPEPNNLENRRYPKIIYAKSWTKVSKDDITKLITS
jgi:hypothetical protein